MRSTSDLDILVEMSDENLAKIVNILKGKGFKVKRPVDKYDIEMLKALKRPGGK